MFRLLLLAAASVVSLCADTPVGGPSLGFIYDARGQAIRPIRGIPGASMIGDPVQPVPVAAAALSLKQNIAVLNDGAWKVLPLDTTGVAKALPDGLPANARIVVSETGTSAAFYDSDAKALTVVSGIGSDSVTANAVALPGAINVLATADDGSMLVSSPSADTGESLIWIAADGGTRQLATLQGAASILLTNRGSMAIVVDRTANQVWQIQNPGGNAAITLVASDADGVNAPSGAALSADGKQLWIANAGAHQILGINLADRTSTTIDCAFDLTALLPMSDGTTFRLNELGGGPLWLLDTAPGADPHVVFVPALVSASPDSTEEGDAQ